MELAVRSALVPKLGGRDRSVDGRGIPTLMRYFTPETAAEAKRQHGPRG